MSECPIVQELRIVYVSKSPNIQEPKYSSAQMSKTQMTECPNIQETKYPMSKSPNVQVPKTRRAQKLSAQKSNSLNPKCPNGQA